MMFFSSEVTVCCGRPADHCDYSQCRYSYNMKRACVEKEFSSVQFLFITNPVRTAVWVDPGVCSEVDVTCSQCICVCVCPQYCTVTFVALCISYTRFQTAALSYNGFVKVCRIVPSHK
jgi:hypothetical protein